MNVELDGSMLEKGSREAFVAYVALNREKDPIEWGVKTFNNFVNHLPPGENTPMFLNVRFLSRMGLTDEEWSLKPIGEIMDPNSYVSPRKRRQSYDQFYETLDQATQRQGVSADVVLDYRRRIADANSSWQRVELIGELYELMIPVVLDLLYEQGLEGNYWPADLFV